MSNYFPYHQRLQERINHNCLGYKQTKSYPGIGDSIVFIFPDYPYCVPIRPHRFLQYEPILCKLEILFTVPDPIISEGYLIQDYLNQEEYDIEEEEMNILTRSMNSIEKTIDLFN